MSFKFLLGSAALSCYGFIASAQVNGFKFGEVRLPELEMVKYPLDSSASAVVLNEFGEAYFDNEDGKLVFEYHTKIKILTKEGLHYGDFRIPLRKSEGRKEEWVSVEAVTYLLEGGKIQKYPFNIRDIFFEKNSPYFDFLKFTLPNVREGCVIEVRYTIKTPFIFNFWPWEFQSEIPKQYSEFWARITGNYTYNISFRGFLALTKNESSLEKSCFSLGSGMADCSLLKYGIKNIPALKEEDYMTAKSNFLSAINFELAEIRHFDGRVDRVTKEWKDVEDELKQHEDFGTQLKKAKSLTDDLVKAMIVGENAPEQRARKIYEWAKSSFSWDETLGKYTDKGVKKTFETKIGNVADINIILLGALQNADLEVDPIILSTRSNGLPSSSLFPVLSEYNYVIARVKIGEAVFLLDATDKFMPFGLLPVRCLNGNGRLLAGKDSGFIDLTSTRGKQRKATTINLTLSEEGIFTGVIQIITYDYEASKRRQEILSASSVADYIKSLESEFNGAVIKDYKSENLKEIEKALIEKFEITLSSDTNNPNRIYFNPFLQDRWKVNPFKSKERLYPVDFGAPLNQTVTLTIEYPANYQLDEAPKSVAFALPEKGGKYTFSVNNIGNKVTMTNTLNLTKAIYNSNEYHFLKELFSRIVQIQQSDFVFLRKE